MGESGTKGDRARDGQSESERETAKVRQQTQVMP